MNLPALDLVVERIVLDGITLPAAQAATLGRLVEEELRLLFAGRMMADGRDTLMVDTKPLALSQPPDLGALARLLARRIAAEAQRAKGEYGR